MPSVRLNKAIADAGVCSRRKADELIAAGRVRVDGQPPSPGQKVDPASQRIEVNGRAIAAPPADNTYLLLYKPVEVVSTASDPQGRRTVLDLVPSHLQGRRLYPVGRLDYFSEGLLLLTDDGELTNRLTHPSHHVDKEYRVRVRGAVTDEVLATFRGGMHVPAKADTPANEPSVQLAPVEVARVKRARRDTTLTLVLRQGVNRQIRRMCDAVGLTVLSLMRVRLGPLRLGKLAAGESRELTAEEVASLHRATASQTNKSRKRTR